MKKNEGITLVALIVTIIILLILAGITIGQLTGDGLFKKTKEAKIKTMLSNAKEEVQLVIHTLMADKYINNLNITPKMISDEVNKINKRETYAENNEIFPTNIIYPAQDTGIGEEIKIKIGNDLEIIEVKTASEKTDQDGQNNPNEGSNNETIEGDIKVEVTITDVTDSSFVINVNPGEDSSKIAMYQYYIDEDLIYEGNETSYRVTGLNIDTNYKISVNVVPKTSLNVATLLQRTDTKKTITIADKFDKIIYIDSNNGNNTTGNGSKEKPYATLDKIADSGIIENGYTYGIVLRDGTYSLTNRIVTLSTNSDLNIIGNRQNTKLYSELECGSGSGIGNENYKINFYRLVLEDNTYQAYEFYIASPISFYNVVFNCSYEGGNGYILPINGENKIENCTVPIGKAAFISIQCQTGNMKLTNCYGNITSGYGTNNSMWNYQTNYITGTPLINSTTYEIIDNESVWKNVGTGTNPDGSQANLGVYGGTYSWWYETDIDS